MTKSQDELWRNREMSGCSLCPCVMGMTVAGNGQTSSVEPTQRSWPCHHQWLFFCFLCPIPQTHSLNICYFQFPLFWYSWKKVHWALSHPLGTSFVWRQFWQNQVYRWPMKITPHVYFFRLSPSFFYFFTGLSEKKQKTKKNQLNRS